MARLALNKSSLARESGQLSEYKRFLPSLELKRLQIMAERAKAKEQPSAWRRSMRSASTLLRGLCR